MFFIQSNKQYSYILEEIEDIHCIGSYKQY